jgi:hypothetical protein
VGSTPIARSFPATDYILSIMESYHLPIWKVMRIYFPEWKVTGHYISGDGLMTDHSRLPTADEARDSLTTVDRMHAAGSRRGVFPRWIIALKTLWAGAMVISFAYQWHFRFFLLLLGAVGVLLLRRYRDAIPDEFHGRGYLVPKIIIVVALVGIFAFARIAWSDYGMLWAPIVSGAVVSAGLFLVIDRKMRSLRMRNSGESQQ